VLTMSLQQLQQRLPEVRAWIDRTLLAHAVRARPVADLGFTRLGSYYSTVLLTSAMVIPIAQVPVPPLAHMGLTGFGEFENLNAAGITYLSSFFVRLGYNLTRTENIRWVGLLFFLRSHEI